MHTVLITPATPVVSLDQAKQHLRVTHDHEDALIAAYVAAATAHIDGPGGWLGRAIGVQTLELRAASFLCGAFKLGFPPLIEVVSMKYLDAAGADATLAPSAYKLRGNALGPAWGQSWPSSGSFREEEDAVRIQYRAGYTTAPAPIVAAILLMAGDLYRNRSEALINQTTDTVAMSTTVQALLAPFRVFM